MSYNSIFLFLSFFLLGCDINVKEKKPNTLRLQFLLMKLLGMVSLVDMRLVDMKTESGTYSNMKKIIKRLIET